MFPVRFDCAPSAAHFFELIAEHGGAQYDLISNRVAGKLALDCFQRNSRSSRTESKGHGRTPGRSLASASGPRAGGPGLVVVCSVVLAVLAGFAAMSFCNILSRLPV